MEKKKKITFKESLSLQFLWWKPWHIADNGPVVNIFIFFCPSLRMA